jgi:hypothetical protein
MNPNSSFAAGAIGASGPRLPSRNSDGRGSTTPESDDGGVCSGDGAGERDIEECIHVI